MLQVLYNIFHDYFKRSVLKPPGKANLNYLSKLEMMGLVGNYSREADFPQRGMGSFEQVYI
jgi:hypothetical protein